MFLNWLESIRNCSVSTRNQRLDCIWSFFGYAASVDSALVVYHIALQKVPQKKSPKEEIVQFMSETAASALLQQPLRT